MRRLDVLNDTLAQNTKYIVPSNSCLVNVHGLDSAVAAAAGAAAGAAVILRILASKKLTPHWQFSSCPRGKNK